MVTLPLKHRGIEKELKEELRELERNKSEEEEIVREVSSKREIFYTDFSYR